LDGASLPPTTDRVIEALDLCRYASAKQRFFEEDETARYLSRRVAEPEPKGEDQPVRGSFSWAVQELGLDSVARFVFALALAPGFDSAIGSVIAACQNDTAATLPTLALAQRLWNEPAEVLSVGETGHPIFQRAMVSRAEPPTAASHIIDWHASLAVPCMIARQLLFPSDMLPAGLRATPAPRHRPREVPPALGQRRNAGLEVVPVLGPRGSEHSDVAAAVSRAMGRDLVAFDGAPDELSRGGVFDSLASLCWLRNLDLFVDMDMAAVLLSGVTPNLPNWNIPVRLFVSVEAPGDLAKIPSGLRLPPVVAPALDYQSRIALWRHELGSHYKKIEPEIAELSRRFRLEAAPIRAICRSVGGSEAPEPEALAAACRAELLLDLGDYAEEIVPRFDPGALILPHKQSVQLDEIRCAMRSLSEVHYQWGTAKVWNESGLSVLFAGPPGTGKTMAAEVLAAELSLPLYRIDLSQVVNKYVGETEKNLKRVFDACEAADLILLFDEADALFGRRTDVKDAHDRYANLEVSYLLSRMERAKGLTILATNRKKDLDDAFIRRLRYVVEFPVPDVQEREKIWAVSIPSGVDAREVDVPFLAERFRLAGGYIRSAVFNACLQSAARNLDGHNPKLGMEEVLVAVKRELEKANRATSLERFEPHSDLVRRLEHAGGSN
jgi:MoxR-like ATPase